MTNPSNSSVTGFQDTSITAIPFQSTIEVNAAIIDISLRHQIQVGFFFDLFATSLAVGIYLDLPKHRSEFVSLEGVDENCTSLATSQSGDKEVAQRVLTDVVQIQRTANWQVGIAGEAKLIGIGDDFDVPFGNGTFEDLESTCLSFNATSRAYADARQVVKEAKKNGAGLSSVTVATCGLLLVGWVVAFLV
jgi:hypothetical protein